MTKSQALALVGTLQAAFPAGAAGSETVQLYATKLEAYDADQGVRAVNRLINERHEAFLPTWAEIIDEIRDAAPRPIEIERGDDGVPPPREFHEARRLLSQKTAARHGEFTGRPRTALGSPVRTGDYVKIIDREGRILWDCTLTGHAARDAAELRWGAEQCGLSAIDMANVMPSVPKPRVNQRSTA